MPRKYDNKIIGQMPLLGDSYDYIWDSLRRTYGKMLREADSEDRWADHLVVWDKSLLCNRSTIVYDDMSVELHIPEKLQVMPRKLMVKYMRDHLNSIGSKDGLRFCKEVAVYLGSPMTMRTTRVFLKARGLFDDSAEVTDAHLELCMKAARKMAPDAARLNGVKAVWRSKDFSNDYIVTTSCPARLIAISPEVGYRSMSELTYIILHEICVMMCYNHYTDEVD